MATAKVELLITQKHPAGDIQAGSIYTYNASTRLYEFKANGVVVSTINEAGVKAFPHMFKKIED